MKIFAFKNYFIRELLADHEGIIVRLRENINLLADKLNDFSTSDFITNLMETHEKMARSPSAHLK